MKELKLSLNKKVIVQLEKNEMFEVQGGIDERTAVTCISCRSCLQTPCVGCPDPSQ